MTYNVFGGTLNLAQSISHLTGKHLENANLCQSLLCHAFTT